MALRGGAAAPSLAAGRRNQQQQQWRCVPPPVAAAAAARPCSKRPVLQQRSQQLRPGRLAAAASDAALPDPADGGAAAAAVGQQQGSDAVEGSAMDPKAVTAWLRQYVPFSLLSPDSVELLASLIRVESVPAGKVLGREGTTPQNVVVVRQGSVRVTGANLPVPIDAGPGATFFLIELLLNQSSSTSVRTSSDATLWLVPSGPLMALAAQKPALVLELGLRLSQEMAGKVDQMEASIQGEERRQRALQPYLVTTPKRGIVGNSKYAERLRKQIVKAARDPERKACIVFGEPGLEKSNVAALLHFGGPARGKPLVQVDVVDMDPFMTELFGRGSREGLLHWLRDGTLVINNVHQAAPHMLPALQRLLADGSYQPAPAPVPLGSMDFPCAERRSPCRVVLTAEARVPQFDGLATIIQVPPLRVRPSDVLDLSRYFMRLLSKQQGVALALTPEAERQLLAYNYPNNVVELKAMVTRAAVQERAASEDAGRGASGSAIQEPPSAAGAAGSSGAGGAVALDKDVFWFAATGKDRFRWSMLTSLPLLRQVLRSDVFPELINHRLVKPVFAAVVLLLFLGPQDRAHNFCLNLFWDWWWPLIFLIYPFLGRIWCSICPFMIYGEVMQRSRVASGAVLRKWPREDMEKWGGWFLFSLFAAILVWEEVWDLPNTAALSSWLLLLITGGAVVCSALFERRLWCRYLCPIGGMNGLFAKLAMTELRARHGVCSGTCSTYHCYKGGPAEPPEGQETLGCPLYTHPANLKDNKDCVLCMTCLKACPHRSIEVRLRLPGVDLWTGHTPTWSELCLQFMLLGAVFLHRVSELEAQFGLDHSLIEARAPHIAASVGIMAVPGLLAWGVDGLQRALAGTNPGGGGGVALAAAGGASAGAASSSAACLPPFLRLGYGYLPLVWGATLAHYLQPLLEEAGTILPATAATFGAPGAGLPVLVANHAVSQFLAGATLAGSAGLSLMLTRKIGGRPWAALAPQCAAVLGFTAELWYLIVR